MDVWKKDRERLFDNVATVLELNKDTSIEKSGVEIESGTAFTDDEFVTVDAERNEIKIFAKVKGGLLDEIIIDRDSNLLVMLEQLFKEAEEVK